jgi:hypothetical protein
MVRVVIEAPAVQEQDGQTPTAVRVRHRALIDNEIVGDEVVHPTDRDTTHERTLPTERSNLMNGR